MFRKFAIGVEERHSASTPAVVFGFHSVRATDSSEEVPFWEMWQASSNVFESSH